MRIMNVLFCSVGRRCELLKDFRNTMGQEGRIVVTDLSLYAPATYFADCFYQVPRITDPSYIPTILDICKKEHINVVTTCIDPEIMILAAHREEFCAIGVEVLAPDEKTARICFDKYTMYRHLVENGVNTVLTFGDLRTFKAAFFKNEISFPVFVKPREGSGSVGARKVDDLITLEKAMEEDPSLIIQEFMGDAVDLDVDVYIDTVSHQPVAIFSKRKLETKIGGASKTTSFKDERLIEFVLQSLQYFKFNGPIDLDLWYRDGKYYLSEINPRFGGAYLHAYGAGVDFVKLIQNNLAGNANEATFGNYEEGVLMMMYDSVVITKIPAKPATHTHTHTPRRQRVSDDSFARQRYAA